MNRMKTTRLKMTRMKLIARIAVSLAFSVLIAGAAAAQSAVKVFQVNVPFQFSVDNKTFPAGRYSLVRLTPHIVILRDSQAHALATLPNGSVVEASASSAPKLVFYVRGNRRVLAQ